MGRSLHERLETLTDEKRLGMSNENFEKLLAELNQATGEQETLAKSVAAAGAADTNAENAAAAAAATGAANPEDEETGDDLAKSIAAAEAATAAAAAAGNPGAAAAEEPVAIPGEEIIKSLGLLDGRTTAVEETLTKGLTAALGLIKGQGELIKSLQEQVTKLGSTGAGRKTVVTVHERNGAAETLAKSMGAPEGLPKAEVLAKANAAFDAKKITGLELTAVDVSLRNGQVPDAAVLAKILS